MRNLIKYPITLQEKLDAIDWALEQLPEDLVGDIRPAALQEVRDLVLREGVKVPDGK